VGPGNSIVEWLKINHNKHLCAAKLQMRYFDCARKSWLKLRKHIAHSLPSM